MFGRALRAAPRGSIKAPRGRAQPGGTTAQVIANDLSTTFTLTSTSTATHPFTIGHAFKQGEVGPGSIALSGASVSAQATEKNYWPDGSVKFAILAGTASLTANTPATITVAAGTASSGTALTTADLKTAMSGQTCSIDCGAFGTVSWATTDFDSPFQTWVSGHKMSSWIYRKAVGADAHLVGWLEVRLFSTGAVEVLPWIENGYIAVASPTGKTATYAFTLGATQRFSQSMEVRHHTRTVLIGASSQAGGTELSYWLGADPQVTPRHNVERLMETELVPTYRAIVASPSVTASYTPFQQGGFTYDTDYMPSTGYAAPIGLLPAHDVAYLVSSLSTTYGSVVRNGFSAGRYGLHYREETAGSGQYKPLRFSSYPTKVVWSGAGIYNSGASTTTNYTPNAGGTQPPLWDTAHAPSVGYMAYLLTGRFYFMEQVQFAATVEYLAQNDSFRGGSSNVINVDYLQTRHLAWALRTLVQALTVTPDADTVLQPEFKTAVERTIDHYHSLYITGTTPSHAPTWTSAANHMNNLGVLLVDNMQYAPYNETVSTWMEDFVTGAFGYALALNLPISTTHASRLDTFFRWKAKWAIERLGPSTGWWYINPHTYYAHVRPDGVWATTFAQAYALTYSETLPDGVNPTSWKGSTEGTLAHQYDISTWAEGYWGNMQPAIAYAVRHNVTGAYAAYNRMISANNWDDLSAYFDSTRPVWSVRPRIPTWLQGKATNTWIEIAGTSTANSNARLSFSGGGIRGTELLIACAGGHGDYSGNQVTGIDLLADAPAWVTRKALSTPRIDDSHYADGTPTSRHTRWTTHFVPSKNRLMLFGCIDAYGNSNAYGNVDGFNLDTNTWDAEGTFPTSGDVYGIQMAAVDEAGQPWRSNGFYNLTTGAAVSTIGTGLFYPMAYDSARNEFFGLSWGSGDGSGSGLNAHKANSGLTTRTAITFSGSATATAAFAANTPYGAGMDYDRRNGKYYFYSGKTGATQRVWTITPNGTDDWVMDILDPTVPDGMTAIPAGITIYDTPGGVYNRWRYVPDLNGFVLMAREQNNIYFLRTA